MNKYSDDPIQEVSKGGFFSRLKRFEDDEEYNFEKKEKTYTNSNINNNTKSNNKYDNNFYNDYSKTKYNNINENANPATKFILFCYLGFFLFCCSLPIMLGYSFQDITTDFKKDPMPFESSLGSKNPVLNDELDNVLFSKAEFLNFDKAGKIPTLYRYDKNTKANWCNFTELDSRFTFNVNTIQFNYDNIPQLSKYELSQGLINRHYELVNNYPTGELYAVNTQNGYFMFVLISYSDIIYGAAQGNYENVFNVMENN